MPKSASPTAGACRRAPAGRRAGDSAARGAAPDAERDAGGHPRRRQGGLRGAPLAALPAALRESAARARTAPARRSSHCSSRRSRRCMRAAARGAEVRGACDARRSARAAVAPLTRELGLAFHLPVVDLALPAVKRARPEAKKGDRRPSRRSSTPTAASRCTSSWCSTLVRHQLAATARRQPARRKRSGELRDRGRDRALARGVCRHARRRAGARDEALQRGDAAPAPPRWGFTMRRPRHARPSTREAALEALRGLAPIEKALLVRACSPR